MPSGAVDLAQGQAIRRQRRRDQISTHPYLEVKSRAQKLKVKQVECVCVCVCDALHTGFLFTLYM